MAVFIDANVIITDESIYLHYRVSGIIDAGDNITNMPTYANLHYRGSGIIDADDNITDIRHRLTYIAVSVVLLVIYHRRADICPTYIIMSVILLILVTISVAILQYIYIAVSAVFINY